MSSFEDIIRKIETLEPFTGREEISLDRALGRVLQQEVKADLDMPPFNKSAVDGYACRREDLENEMEVLEKIAAGMMPSTSINRNQCAAVMTGAAVPGGTDCVFMTEDTEYISEKRVRCINPASKTNIAYFGEDYRKGEVLLDQGTIIQPEHLAVIAGAGLEKISVSTMPSAGLIVTGSELVEHYEVPGEGKIRNTNGIQMLSLLQQLHIPVRYYGVVADEKTVLQQVFRQAVEECELVLITGGAADGDFDLVPGMIVEEGFTLHWKRTGLKPGNPMSFGTKGNSCVFGLSGNPVSSLVQFKYIVVAVIYRLLGAHYVPFRIKGIMKDMVVRKNASRLGVVPVYVDRGGEVMELPFNGSAHINALSKANALMEIPAGIAEIKAGERVYVRPL